MRGRIGRSITSPTRASSGGRPLPLVRGSGALRGADLPRFAIKRCADVSPGFVNVSCNTSHSEPSCVVSWPRFCSRPTASMHVLTH